MKHLLYLLLFILPVSLGWAQTKNAGSGNTQPSMGKTTQSTNVTRSNTITTQPTTTTTKPVGTQTNTNSTIRPQAQTGTSNNSNSSNNSSNNSNPNQFSTQQPTYSYNTNYNTFSSASSFSNSNQANQYESGPTVMYDDPSFGSTIYALNSDGSRIVLENSSDPDAFRNSTLIKERIEKKQVHFTGLVMSDTYWESHTTKAYVSDKYSEFLGPGKYERIGKYLSNPVKYTFDGIAVPPGTRLVIYSGTNFTGNIIVDVTGPAIINNVKWVNDPRYMTANTKMFTPELQYVFPQNTRNWSISNMHNWQDGSIEIIAQ